MELEFTEKLSIITNKRLLRHRRIHVKILLRKVFVAGLRKESGCVFYVKARHFESCTARNLKITKHSQRKEREKGKMLKKLMKKEEGFTLAELLIVVAIIAVLVAISIPIFTSQLEKSREATDSSNIRAAYAEVMTDALVDSTYESKRVVELKQQVENWQNAEDQANLQALAVDQNAASGIMGVSVDLSGVAKGKKVTVL